MKTLIALLLFALPLTAQELTTVKSLSAVGRIVTATIAADTATTATLNATAIMTAAAQTGSVFVMGKVTNGGNAGRVRLMMAKVTSGTCTIRAGTTIIGIRIS